jgi:type IV pilus assembly protein PilQ
MMTSILALISALLVGGGDPVTALSVLPNLARTEILVEIDGDVEHRVFQMEGPNRIILDLMNAQHQLPQYDYLDINRGGVRAIRTSQYSEDIVRVEIELDGKVGYAVEKYDNYVRISIENPHGAEQFDPWESLAISAKPTVTDQMAALMNGPAGPESAVETPQEEGPLMSVSFDGVPIEDVLLTFADYSGKSIVGGQNISAGRIVTAEIKDQRWDEALDAILISQGLMGTEMDNGIIRVELIDDISAREQTEPRITIPYRISFGTAEEMQTAIQPLLTPGRGQSVAAPNTNTVIVSDIQRVHDQVRQLISSLDVATPQVMISAKIIFVNRTDLDEIGVSYELKDSQGNQINVLAPGAADLNGDGKITTVPIGTNVVTLGGNSIAALGNATNRVAGSTLSLLTSLVVGRHSLIAFIDALQSSNLSDIVAEPSLMVADNQTANIQVGEDTPIRVIDASGGAGGGGSALPTASVSIQSTGIILRATPHITAGDHILLDVRAERSSVDVTNSDIGQIFRTQNASTRVLVRDGETVVIAGLTVTERSEIRTGIPLLMDLPLLGKIFRTQRATEVQRDLMILVTPNIVRSTFGN